ncbi:MAG: ABC transporter permease [Rhodothermales bacterium]
MLKNYFKIAIRNLRRHPFYAFVNIFGLALGIGCCVLIILFIQDEWSYDQFHEDADRIYRIALHEQNEDREYLNVETPYLFAEMFTSNMPEVEDAIRVRWFRDQVQLRDRVQLERVFLADPGFFQLFDFPLLRGDPETVLQGVHNLVLSEDAAARWFKDEDPIGQTISIRIGDEPEDFVVSGISANTPTNSSIRFDFLVPLDHVETRWGAAQLQSLFDVLFETYIRLPENYDIAQLEAKVPAMIEQAMGTDYVEGAYVPRFQKLTDIHLDTSYPAGAQPTSDPAYSFILAIIAAFVLLIACINFMTLTLSRSAERAKEVGVRKTLGANRQQVVAQFWGETLLFSVFGLILGLVLAVLALPAFNTLAGKTLSFRADVETWLALVGLVGIVGLLAGSYPALFLSRYRPIEVLKGRLKLGEANVLRKTLTVVQFTLAVLLIISTLVMGDQLRFMQEKNLGFDKEQVVKLTTGLRRPEAMQVLERFRAEAAGYTEIDGVTASMFTFGETWMSAAYKATDGAFQQFNYNLVDVDYLDVMRIPVVEGRDFSRDIGSDRREGVIVNRAFAEMHGWENPIGEMLPGARFAPHRIIGVVDDFNYASLHSKVAPLALALTPMPLYEGLSDIGYSSAPQPKILVRLKAGEIAAGLAVTEQLWNTVMPGIPFNYAFVDDVLEYQYGQELRLGAILKYATVLVILIACLGLFGLASLMVVRRTKEIGVRKVMGASAKNIVVLLTKDIVVLVGLAFLIAAPAAYYIMSVWLQDFAYATAMSALTFFVAGLLIIGIALLTVSFQSIRAAFSNPIDALRYE